MDLFLTPGPIEVVVLMIAHEMATMDFTTKPQTREKLFFA